MIVRVSFLLALFMGTAMAFPLPDSNMCDGLQECYSLYNRLYYDNALPPADVAYGPCPIAKVMACTYMEGSRFTVRLVVKYNLAPSTAHFNLLHETCHIAHWNADLNDHGPTFQKCMHRLANMDAFETLW
jgi:hypothetical protein